MTNTSLDGYISDDRGVFDLFPPGAVSTADTRLERHFGPSAVRALKAAAGSDLTVGGQWAGPRRRADVTAA